MGREIWVSHTIPLPAKRVDVLVDSLRSEVFDSLWSQSSCLTLTLSVVSSIYFIILSCPFSQLYFSLSFSSSPPTPLFLSLPLSLPPSLPLRYRSPSFPPSPPTSPSPSRPSLSPSLPPTPLSLYTVFPESSIPLRGIPILVHVIRGTALSARPEEPAASTAAPVTPHRAGQL